MNFQLAAFQFLAGGMGGLVRALVGITKSATFNPDTFKFQWKSFAITIIVSIITGQMAGLILNADWRMSLLAGYAFMSSISLAMVLILGKRAVCPPLTMFIQYRINSSNDLSFQTAQSP